jgi:hypothetical protein
MEKEVGIGLLAALYAVIEVLKWVINLKSRATTCLLSAENQRKIDDLHTWHDIVDDEGRRIWYVPKHLHVEQEKIVEMLRGISQNQETTARLLGELIRRMEK